MKIKSLYDIWIEFMNVIVGVNAPTIIYAFSFILFLVLLFGSFLGVIKFLFAFFRTK